MAKALLLKALIPISVLATTMPIVSCAVYPDHSDERVIFVDHPDVNTSYDEYIKGKEGQKLSYRVKVLHEQATNISFTYIKGDLQDVLQLNDIQFVEEDPNTHIWTLSFTLPSSWEGLHIESRITMTANFINGRKQKTAAHAEICLTNR